MESKPTKPIIQVTRHSVSAGHLNDIGFRLVLIPFFGIVIPLITRMVDHQSFSSWQIKFSYLYTIGIAFVVWQGNRYLLFTLRSYFNWFNKPIRKILALLLSVSFYTIPVSTLLLVGWYYLFEAGNINWQVVSTSTLIIMISVLFIVHVYETVFLVKDSESEMVRSEQLARAKAQAELEALKNQIAPHFIFNSLNTLSHLIDEKPGRAKLFNDNLADVYRYILQNNKRDLVMLREEIQFLKDYFSLLKIRFERAVDLVSEIPEEAFDQYLIPPISLQLLVENAIKHNEFSDDKPLAVRLTMNGNSLLVTNKINSKNIHQESPKIGLKNLEERYKLITNSSLQISSGDSFTVGLPLLKIE